MKDKIYKVPLIGDFNTKKDIVTYSLDSESMWNYFVAYREMKRPIGWMDLSAALHEEVLELHRSLVEMRDQMDYSNIQKQRDAITSAMVRTHFLVELIYTEYGYGTDMKSTAAIEGVVIPELLNSLGIKVASEDREPLNTELSDFKEEEAEEEEYNFDEVEEEENYDDMEF